MEVEAMKRLVNRWEDDEKVDTVITDQDSKLGKVIRDSWWGVKHEFDANHAKKSLNRYRESLSKQQRQHLSGLGQRLDSWFNHVIHEPVDREQRVAMRENAYDHYCGDHTRCPRPGHEAYGWTHQKSPEARQTLKRYLAEGSKIIRKIDPLRGSTQWNESFHAVKAKYADKRQSFPGSTEARFALTVASHSGGPDGARNGESRSISRRSRSAARQS
jgi:hypothetical protein